MGNKKKVALILLLLITSGILTALYLFPGRNYYAINNDHPPVDRTANGSPSPRKTTKNGLTDIVDLGAQKAGEVGTFIEKAPRSLEDRLTETLRGAMTGVRNGVAGLLGLPVPQDNASPAAGQANGNGPGNLPELQICSSRAKGEEISYVIKNPFFPKEGFTYDVDWGDSNIFHGSAKDSEEKVSVSHSYSRSGNYTNIFRIVSTSGTVTTQRSVCIG